MTERSPDASLEARRLAFDERKWNDEFALRRMEAEAKLRESSAFNRLVSPFTATVLVGAITVLGSVGVAYTQSHNSQEIERQKADANRNLEEQKYRSAREIDIRKQQHELILKMIGVDNVDQARVNLKFLAETKLIKDEELARLLVAVKETPLVKPPAAANPFAAAVKSLGSTDIRHRASLESLEMIALSEIGSDISKYNPKPRMNGPLGGVVIGLGYDLAFVSAEQFAEDWTTSLGRSEFERLRAVVGLKGDAAAAVEASVSDIDVSWDAASAVFITTLSRWAVRLDAVLPNARELPASSYGALLSLLYNRGPSFGRDGDRYKEMRDILALMQAKDFAGIPQKLRDMKRIWPDVPALQARREREAALFEDGLRQARAGLQ